MRQFESAPAAEAFEAYPAKVRRKLLFLRQLIFDTAAKTDGVGEIEWAPRWLSDCVAAALTYHRGQRL